MFICEILEKFKRDFDCGDFVVVFESDNGIEFFEIRNLTDCSVVFESNYLKDIKMIYSRDNKIVLNFENNYDLFISFYINSRTSFKNFLKKCENEGILWYNNDIENKGVENENSSK